MKREIYLQKVLDFIESHNDKESDFFDKLVLADYGDLIGECDVCGHNIRYAFCLKVDWRDGSPKDTDDNVIIGTTCINKVCSLTNMQEKFEEKFKEYKKIISQIRKLENNKSKRKLFLTIGEAKSELQLVKDRERRNKQKQQKIEFVNKQKEREEKHEQLMKNNELYKNLYNKFEGFVRYKNESEEDIEQNFKFNQQTTYYINSHNKFLNDLFRNHLEMELSEKQIYWFNKIGEELINKNIIDWDNVKKDLKNINCNVKLSLYDSGFVESLEKQLLQRGRLSDKQLESLNKIKYKYRKQLDEVNKNE